MTTDIAPTPAAKPTDEQMLQAHGAVPRKHCCSSRLRGAVAAEKAAIALRTQLIGDAVHEMGIPNRIILQACSSLTPMKVNATCAGTRNSVTPAGDTLARMARRHHYSHWPLSWTSARGRASGRLSDWFTGEDAESQPRSDPTGRKPGLLFRGLK